MRVQLEDLKTGWYDVSLGLKKKDIVKLVGLLNTLSNAPDQHFHLASNYKGKGGISDIEIYLDNEDSPDNLSLCGFAK